MDILLEVLKYTIPALVVFATAYYILKQHFQHQWKLRSIEHQEKQLSQSLPLKLQAYERIALFLERIRIQHLILRLNQKGITNSELANVLMLGLHQEYEHNLVQQVYVSENLWKIVELAKNETLHIISEQRHTVDPNGDSTELSNRLIYAMQQQTVDPIDSALTAIKKEISLLL